MVFVAKECFQFHCYECFYLIWKLPSHAVCGYPRDLCSKHCSATYLALLSICTVYVYGYNLYIGLLLMGILYSTAHVKCKRNTCFPWGSRILHACKWLPTRMSFAGYTRMRSCAGRMHACAVNVSIFLNMRLSRKSQELTESFKKPT